MWTGPSADAPKAGKAASDKATISVDVMPKSHVTVSSIKRGGRLTTTPVPNFLFGNLKLLRMLPKSLQSDPQTFLELLREGL
jgi:hypothetical protein